MLIDALLAFIPPGTNQSMVAGAGISIPSVGLIDLLGQGVGTAPANIIGNATVFGSDQGIGGEKPLVQAVVGTAFVTATAATLNVAFQAAPDTGVGGGYQPGAWQTLVETGPLTAAQLTAGQILARFDFPPAFPANLSPRYLRLLFQVPAATDFTAGTIASAIITMARDDLANKFAAGNFTVA